MKPKYKVGQKVNIPFEVTRAPGDENGGLYVADIDLSLVDIDTDSDTAIYLTEQELMDLVEYSDPVIRKQKLKEKIDKLQSEYEKL